MAVQMTKADRIVQITQAGLQLADRCGLANVTLTRLASELDIDHPLIIYHCGSINKVKTAISQAAVENGNDKVVYQAVMLGLLQESELPQRFRKFYQQMK